LSDEERSKLAQAIIETTEELDRVTKKIITTGKEIKQTLLDVREGLRLVQLLKEMFHKQADLDYKEKDETETD